MAVLIPLTYFLELLRGVILKGVGLAQLWLWILPLAVLMILFFSLAVIRFQRSFD